jgi:hypothetical protein
VIQFPAGHHVGSPQPPAATPDPAATRDVSGVPASALEDADDSVGLQGVAVTALEMAALRLWDDGAGRTTGAAGAAEYQMAADAVQGGDASAGLQHLEQAILAHPMHADAARQDPAFDAIRGPVLDLVGRVSLLARIHAEASIVQAALTIESAHGLNATGHGQVAKAYFDVAQSHFQLATYAGYVEAAQAALRAQQIASPPEIKPDTIRAALPVPEPGSGLWPIRAAFRKVLSELWQKLPVLVVLLAWFLAGIVAGVASLPFHEGILAEIRRTLFPIWAMGLLAGVLFGFLRSIWRLARRRQS